MDLTIDPSTRALVDTVRRFVQERLQPLEDEVERTGSLAPELARAIFEESSALGLYGMNMPQALGGGGLDTVQMCLVEEQAGHTKDILIRRAFGNVYEVLLACEGAQRERWLIPAVRGARVCSIAITEPGAGSDAASVRTRAVRHGDGWRLNGAKHFISDADFSDFYVVLARTDDARFAGRPSLFLVDKQLPGLTAGPDQPMMGLTGTRHLELHFDDVPLDSDCLLGEEGRGMRLVLDTLGRIRLAHIGARAIGMAERILAYMVEHARSRQQFGAAIGEFQMVQQMLADSAMELNAARLMIVHTAWRIDQGLQARENIAMVKVQAAEMLNRVADRAVQIFGGSGYAKAGPVERFYRDARVFRIYDGTSEIHRSVVAQSILKDGTDFIRLL